MNRNGILGETESLAGRGEAALGDAMGDTTLSVKGRVREAGGEARRAAGKAQDAFQDVADRLSDHASRLSSQAREAAERARVQARKMADNVDPFVHERPYVAIGAGVAVGLLVGLLLAAGRSNVVYVKSPND
jgi:ElaB/YqjD/DUF883 family membrane-anchored ribosome-binding protein